MSTSIEWCRNPDGSPGMVWNPVTGCTPAGSGCAHCYAASMARSFWKGRKFSEVRCHPERLDLPRYWKKPRMVFVNSMSDLFHEAVPESFILQVMNVVQQCPQHTFVVLTKRPEINVDNSKSCDKV